MSGLASARAMRLPAVMVQIAAILVQLTFVSTHFATVAAQFTMFPGGTGLVAFAPLMTQFMSIPITFADVMMCIAAVVTQFFPVAVRRLRRPIGGKHGRYRGQRHDGSENYQARFTHETCSPDVGLRKKKIIFRFGCSPTKVCIVTNDKP